MAKKRRRRRAAGAVVHRRRRRRNPFGLSLRRHRRRGHVGRVRHRRRRRSNPFGLGKGKGGIFQLPDITAAFIGALGGVATGLILDKIDKPDAAGKRKLPALVGPDGKPAVAGYAVRILAGILVGGVAGKLLKKPALGASWALGATVVYTAAYLNDTKMLSGKTSGVGDYVTDYYGGETSGAEYKLPGPLAGTSYQIPEAMQGVGDGFQDMDLDEITQTPF